MVILVIFSTATMGHSRASVVTVTVTCVPKSLVRWTVHVCASTFDWTVAIMGFADPMDSLTCIIHYEPVSPRPHRTLAHGDWNEEIPTEHPSLWTFSYWAYWWPINPRRVCLRWSIQDSEYFFDAIESVLIKLCEPIPPHFGLPPSALDLWLAHRLPFTITALNLHDLYIFYC